MNNHINYQKATIEYLHDYIDFKGDKDKFNKHIEKKVNKLKQEVKDGKKRTAKKEDNE